MLFRSLDVVKRAAVGGPGGKSFDSGVNGSGLASIATETGPYKRSCNILYIDAIKRLHLTFNNGGTTKGNLYHGFLHHNRYNRTMQIEFEPHDSIYKVVLSADDFCVNAIQFHTMAVLVSPTYGAPLNDTILPTEIVLANATNETIVGVHGRFGVVG